jgi:hypothetical protein
MRRRLVRLRNPLLFRIHPDRRTLMKIKKALLVSTLLAASSLAMAQGAGGAGGGAGGGSGGPAGNDPSTSAGANASTREGGDTGSGTMSHSTTKKHSSKSSKTTKPATDTTNMPGANASSDTKGK